MRYLPIFVVVIAAVGLAGCARNSSDTIDGRPIPPRTFAVDHSQFGWQQQVCSNLRGVVAAEARESAGRRLSVTVTDADLKAAASHVVGTSDADLAKRREGSVALAAGFAAVIDRGEDPHVVYEELVRQHGIPENAWLSLLNAARNVPGNRKRMERDSTLTPEQLKAETAAATAPPKMAFAARYEQINKAVDRFLAADDPQFRAYLAEYNPDATQHPMNGEHSAYLAGARARFWRDAMSKLDIRLADPAWFDTCKLAELGAKPGNKRIF